MSVINVTTAQAMDILSAMFADVRIDINDGYLGTADSKLRLIETLCSAVDEPHRDVWVEMTQELKERAKKAREEKE